MVLVLALTSAAARADIRGVCRADSGPLDNIGTAEAIVWQEEIDSTLPSTRLRFSLANLPAGSRVRLTSLLDHEVQELTATTFRDWRNTSAFFNGARIRVELVAGPGTLGNQVVVSGCIASLAVDARFQPRAICGADDDRVPSSNPAIGRLMLVDADQAVNCTGTIVDCPGDSADKCHLTAGHCFEGYSDHVLQFEVPASQADCALVHPPVRKQFPLVQPVAASVPSVPGDDWAVFRVARNSAGLTSFEEQGAALVLADSIPSTGTVRITGYGIDANEGDSGGSNGACTLCDPGTGQGARNSVQQTHSGAIVGTTGEITHRVDTCGGNSGSVIVLDSTSEVIGIHTNAGCETGAATNSGTRIDQPDLATALGHCKTPQLLVLLDRTGSMLAVRANGHSRCRDALALARQDITSFFDLHGGTPGVSAAVWTFADNGPTALTGFVDETQALAALDGLAPEGCSGSTPLAEALCSAGDQLSSTFPPAGSDRLTLAVSSDGGENNSDGTCAGPWSVAGPPYEPGSWQQKVTDHLRGHQVILSRFWGEVTRSESLVDPETGLPHGLNYPDALFFEDLAAATGGDHQFVDDGDGLPPPFFSNGGGPIVLEVPTLGGAGLALLTLLLVGAASWVLRRP
jgi:hypothetical protein